MDQSQSLNAPLYFDGSNYTFWKVRMRAFLRSMDETIWDAMDVGWTRLEAAKSTWDKATFAASNANSKALNVIFCGISLMSSTGYLTFLLPRRRGRYWRQCMKEQRK